MTDVSFHTLCAQMREAVQGGLPEFQRSGDSSSLSLRVKGVAVTVACVPSMPESVVALAELGELPAARELDAMLALLDANFVLRGEPMLSIGRNVQGTAVLLATRRIADTTANGLLASLADMADFALRWRDGHFLESNGSPAHAQARPVH